MKKIKKKKYNNGSYVSNIAGPKFGQSAQAAGGVANMLGSAVGGAGGGFLSGAGSGASMGAAFGPPGMAIGAILGGLSGIFGANAKAKRERRADNKSALDFNKNYQDKAESELDTTADNQYGMYANGSFVEDGDPKKKKTSIVTKRGMTVTDKDLLAYKNSNLDFGTKEALGTWLDSWGNEVPISNNNGLQQGISTATNSKMPTYGYGINQAQRMSYDEWGYVAPKLGLTTSQYDGRKGLNPDLTNTINNHLTNFRTGKYADGSEVQENLINIEKGELQIDPSTGKVLREYNGMNPETGGLYAPHSKGKDTKHNIVSADPGTFVITKALSTKYKNAIDNNDKLASNTILKNIKNTKDSKDKADKMAWGSFVDPDPSRIPLASNRNGSFDVNRMMQGILNPMRELSAPAPYTSVSGGYQPQKQIGLTGINTSPQLTSPKEGFGNKALDALTQYGPGLLNIGRGMFGKVEQTAHVNPTINPYKSQILNNMPQDISLDPARQQLMRQQNVAFNQIDNSTYGSPIARANKMNTFANTQNALGMLTMDQQTRNNQVASQRAGIYSGLASQEMGATDRAQQLNMGIDEANMANRGAKQNLLSTGLGQLQQTYFNNKTNKQQKDNEALRTKLMFEMFPNLRYYSELFKND